MKGNEMYRITGTIKGVAPLLINTPTAEDFGIPDEGTKKAPAGQSSKLTPDEYRAKAMRRLQRKDGMIFMPGVNLYRCMIAGCSKAGMKEGRKAMWPFLEATCFIDHELPFGKTEPDYIDERPGRIPPKTGAMVMIYRPAFKEGWELPFGITVTDDRRRPDDVRFSIENGGLMSGIGAGRPMFGRFIVTEWNVEKAS